jgi:mono/diheme cytochrome c family protein
MLRIVIATGLTLLATLYGALAETPVERGAYLTNTIMACGNCHSPRDADGKSIADMAFSGGLTFTTPPFVATAPNITLKPPMAYGYYANLGNADLADIVAYLRTVPALQ